MSSIIRFSGAVAFVVFIIRATVVMSSKLRSNLGKAEIGVHNVWQAGEIRYALARSLTLCWMNSTMAPVDVPGPKTSEMPKSFNG